MSAAALLVGFIVSTIGISFFIYGKKQRREPQLVVGVLLLVCPCVLPVVWTVAVAVALIVALWFAVRAGW